MYNLQATSSSLQMVQGRDVVTMEALWEVMWSV